jgi:hypothetical protein
MRTAVIVGLGAGFNPDGSTSTRLINRAIHSAELREELLNCGYNVCATLFTGAATFKAHGIPEALAMAMEVKKRIHRPGLIILETRIHHTLANAHNSARKLCEEGIDLRGIDDVFIVTTNSLHALRSWIYFQFHLKAAGFTGRLRVRYTHSTITLEDIRKEGPKILKAMRYRYGYGEEANLYHPDVFQIAQLNPKL